MTQPANGTILELQRIVRMLDRTAELAQEVDVTGDAGQRSAAAIRTYNATLQHLASMSQIPTALFPPLADDASLADVGISSAQLAEYLRGGLPEEAQGQPQSPSITRNLNFYGPVDMKGNDKDDLGQMIRDHLAEWFGAAKPEPTPADGEEPAGEAAASPGSSPQAASSEPAAGSRRAALPSQARVEELRTEGQAEGSRRQ
jgi:hypothetical protein